MNRLTGNDKGFILLWYMYFGEREVLWDELPWFEQDPNLKTHPVLQAFRHTSLDMLNFRDHGYVYIKEGTSDRLTQKGVELAKQMIKERTNDSD